MSTAPSCYPRRPGLGTRGVTLDDAVGISTLLLQQTGSLPREEPAAHNSITTGVSKRRRRGRACCHTVAPSRLLRSNRRKGGERIG